MAHSRGTQPNLLEWLKKASLDEGQLGPQVLKAGVSQARGHGSHSLKNFLFKDSYLLLYLAVSGLNCGMQDLVLSPGIQSWAPCIGSMEPQLLDHQRSPMKTFQHGKQVSANVTQDLSLLATGLRTCMSILPKGPRWEGGPKGGPPRAPARGYPAQSNIFCHLFGLYSPISLPIGSHPLFTGQCFWDHGTLSSRILPALTIHILLVQRGAWGSSGCT